MNSKTVLSWEEFTPRHMSLEAINAFKSLHRRLVKVDRLTSSFNSLIAVSKASLLVIITTFSKYKREVAALMKVSLQEIDGTIGYYQRLYEKLDNEAFEDVSLNELEEIPLNVELFLDQSELLNFFQST